MGLDNFDKILDDVLSLSDEELPNLPVDSFIKDAFDTFDILQKMVDNIIEDSEKKNVYHNKSLRWTLFW